MPPRKRTGVARNGVAEETQRIVTDDLDITTGATEATSARRGGNRSSKRGRDDAETAAHGRLAPSSSEAASNVPGLSRANRRLAALLTAHNPPTLPQSSVLGALSMSDESETDRSDSSASVSDAGSEEDGEEKTRTSPPRSRRGHADVTDDSPVARLTVGRHTVSLSKTMKQFAAVPHHLATTSAFVGRGFKAPSSTAVASASHSAASALANNRTPQVEAPLVVPFIDTQLADDQTERHVDEARDTKTASSVSATAARSLKGTVPEQASGGSTSHGFTAPQQDKRDAPQITSSSSSSAPSTHMIGLQAYTDGTESELLSDTQVSPNSATDTTTTATKAVAAVTALNDAKDGDALADRAVTLLGAAESPVDEGRAHHPDDADLGGFAPGDVLLDSLGGPSPAPPHLTPIGDDEDGDDEEKRVSAVGVTARAHSDTLSSASSTPRLMITPLPPGGQLLGGGSVGKLSPLSALPPAKTPAPHGMKADAATRPSGTEQPTPSKTHDTVRKSSATPTPDVRVRGSWDTSPHTCRRGHGEDGVDQSDDHDQLDRDSSYSVADDYAQTLAVYDLSLRSAAPAADLFDSVPPEDLLATDTATRTEPSSLSDKKCVADKNRFGDLTRTPTRGVTARPTPSTASTSVATADARDGGRVDAAALPETLDDGCDKTELVHEADATPDAVLDHEGELSHRRLGTEMLHTKRVAAARQKGEPRVTPPTDPFLTPHPSLPKAGRACSSPSRQDRVKEATLSSPSPAPSGGQPTASPPRTSRPPFTVGMRVEARWGRNWYAAVVSEDERGGFVQIRWADEDEDAVMHLKVREVRLPKTAAKASAQKAPTPHAATKSVEAKANSAAAPQTTGSSFIAPIAGELVTASQLAELMELEVLPVESLNPNDARHSAPTASAAARKRSRSCTGDGDSARDDGVKLARADAPVTQPARVHSSHVVLFLSCGWPRQTSRTTPLASATTLRDFETFRHFADQAGEVYHAMETEAEGNGNDHDEERTTARTNCYDAPPLCVYVVTDDSASVAESALTAAAQTAAGADHEAASPAASWEVLIAHALGLAAVSSSWLSRVDRDTDTFSDEADTRIPLPHDGELLHVLRHYTSPRVSAGTPASAAADSSSTEQAVQRRAAAQPTAQTTEASPSTKTAPSSSAAVPTGFFPWRPAARFLHGKRVYMSASPRIDAHDPMARLIRAAGGEPVPASPASSSSVVSAHASHTQLPPMLDFVYVPPGTDSAQALATLLAANAFLKGVPLLELPWLVKNIEAQFAKRVRSVQRWWCTRSAQLPHPTDRSLKTRAAACAKPEDDSVRPWTLPRPSPISVVKLEAANEEPSDVKPQHGDAPLLRGEHTENTEIASLVSLPRPPPLPTTKWTTPTRHAAQGPTETASSGPPVSHQPHRGGGISPTTIAAIKARGRRGPDSGARSARANTRAESTSNASDSKGAVNTRVGEGAHSSAHRMLSYGTEGGGVAHDKAGPPGSVAEENVPLQDTSPSIFLDCPAHPPVNQGEDYYYRVPAPSTTPDACIAHELGLGRVAGVDHNVLEEEQGQLSEASAPSTTVCLVHLQLYTVRRVFMRQNPITQELEQQTTLALTRRCVTVPSSVLLFDVPVYVVNAAAMRHVYVLEDEETDGLGGSDGSPLPQNARDNRLKDRPASAVGMSQAPIATATISPPRPTVRLEVTASDAATSPEREPRRARQFYGDTNPLPAWRMF